jgi:hypothetical protein
VDEFLQGDPAGKEEKCPGQESNLHDQKRSLGPQPSASTNSATWAMYLNIPDNAGKYSNFRRRQILPFLRMFLKKEIADRAISFLTALNKNNLFDSQIILKS